MIGQGPRRQVRRAGWMPVVRPAARWTETGLLAVALVVLALGVATLAVTWERALDDARFWPAYAVGATLVVTHLMLVATGNRGDQVTFPVVACLVGVGIVIVTRLVPDAAARQATWVALGATGAVVVAAGPWETRHLERFKYAILVAGIALVALTLVAGRDLNGSGDRLWLGLLGYVFQPSELLKIVLVLFLAGYLTEKRAMLLVAPSRLWGVPVPPIAWLIPLVAMWGGCLVLLVVQRDLGSALLFYATFLAMLHVAIGRARYVVGSVAVFGVGAYACFRLFAHVRLRVEVWLDPWVDPLGRSYQIVQAMYAMASGGIAGRGLGNGYPLYVPAAHTDYPFVAFAEEAGLAGSLALVLAYAVLVASGLGIAMRARDPFRQLLAAGLAAVIAFQVVTIVGGNVRLIPLTGVTLPFVSYGGSSMLASWLLLGLLLRASHEEAGDRPGAATTGSPGAMGAHARSLGTLFLALFGVLAAFAGYWQAVASGALAAAPQNPRLAQDGRHAMRGQIVDRHGNVVVESRADGTRHLLVPSLGHVVGYRSARYGTSGVERAEDAALTGTGAPLSYGDLVRQVARLPGRGANVGLTIDPDVQAAAAAALGDAAGAAIALDTRTGAVLAMASNPPLPVEGIDARWSSLLADPAKPLVNRAAQGLYVPGSTFKVVTAAAAIDSGVMTLATITSDPTGEVTIDGFRVTDAMRPPRPTFDFARAFAWSSNVVFAEVGGKIGEARLRDYAGRFGIGTALPLGIDTSATSVGRTSPMPPSLLASTAFGQGELLLSPLQVAVIAATIARDGDVPRPWIVAEVVAQVDGGVATVRRTHPASLGRAVTPATAGAVRAMMGLAVDDGFSGAGAITGVRVGGKTGTGQSVPGRPDHAWFVGIAPLDAPRVAVVVLREFGGWGAEAAAPMARPVLQAGLQATAR